MQAFREWPGYDFFCGSNLHLSMENCKAESHSGQQNKRKNRYQCAEILIQCKQVFVASLNEHINKLYR